MQDGTYIHTYILERIFLLYNHVYQLICLRIQKVVEAARITVAPEMEANCINCFQNNLPKTKTKLKSVCMYVLAYVNMIIHTHIWPSVCLYMYTLRCNNVNIFDCVFPIKEKGVEHFI